MLALLLVACTPAPPSFTDADAALVWADTQAPGSWASIVAAYAVLSDADCPSVTTDAGTTMVVGGCYVGTTTYDGAIAITLDGDGRPASWAFDGWATTNGQIGQKLDGTQTLDGATLTSAFDLDAFQADDLATFDGYVVDDEPAFAAWLDHEPATWHATGGLAQPGKDTWSVDVTVEHAGTCSSEPDAGTATYTSAEGDLTLTFDGATSCDACIPWVRGDLSGFACR